MDDDDEVRIIEDDDPVTYDEVRVVDTQRNGLKQASQIWNIRFDETIKRV